VDWSRLGPRAWPWSPPARHFEAAAEQFRVVSGVFPAALGHLAGTLRALGREDEAGRVRAALEQASRRQHVSPLSFAASSNLQDHAARLRWIGQAFDEREGNVPLLNVDPMMDDLRSEPAFQDLISRLGLPRAPVGPCS
jgi:hypothetical protein